MKRARLPIAAMVLFFPAVAFAAPGEFEALKAQGWLTAFLGVFAAGFLTSLTPCVYPMISITVGIFGAREATSRWRSFGLATMYVLGMVVMYAGLGVIFALSGRMSGSGFLLARPEVVIPIVVLYAVLAASMFGAFELNLPPALQAKLSGVGGKGTVGAFLMGLVGGLTAAPCTGPMLAGVLAFVATTRNVALGAGLMTTFALGMGVLFWVIATFALRLPKSGAWMEVVKALGGIALITVGVYFLRPIWPAVSRLTGTSNAFLGASLGVVLLGLALIYVYVRRLVRERPHAGVWKVAGIVATIAGAVLVMNYTLTPKHPLPWRHDRDTALAEARAARQPALVDFSASYCKPCKLYETDVFSDPVVHAEVVARFLPVKFDVSLNTREDREAQARWDAAALPTVILLDRDGNEAGRFNEPLPSADEFLRAIRAVR